MKKILLIVLVLIVGCDNSTEPEEENIPLPTEFPLEGNTGWVYSILDYANAEDYIIGVNADTTIDTLVIIDTMEDYFIYNWLRSPNSYSLVKNEQNKFILIGSMDNQELTLYEKPIVWADYDPQFNIDSINTLDYDYDYYQLTDRTETTDTLFNTPYNSYLFKMSSEDGSESWHCGKIGWIKSSGSYNYEFGYDGFRFQMIEKLDNIEVNLSSDLSRVKNHKVTSRPQFIHPFTNRKPLTNPL